MFKNVLFENYKPMVCEINMEAFNDNDRWAMWPIDLLYICSNDELCKKASISFGIQFDTHKYNLLLSCLKDIIIHKDRVSLKINFYRFEPYKNTLF